MTFFHYPIVISALFIPLAVISANFALGADREFADQDQKAKASDVITDVRLRSSVFIKAQPNLVWLTIHEQRVAYRELEYAKILLQDDTSSVTEQRFVVALLGKASCTFRMTDQPPNQIEYQLLKSNMFAVMDGKWVMTPTADKRSTRLDLYCHAGLQRKVPRFLLKLGLGRSLKRHLLAIGKSAEEKARSSISEVNVESAKTPNL